MTSLTFMAVHAHPDDEASSTGGLYRLLADQGVRTVLVTCTNGECGDDENGRKPLDKDHDDEGTAAVRRVELDRAVEILGISRLVRLNYRDSGMMGWPQNEHPESFWQADVTAAATRLADIIREEKPQVIVTYNEIGFYGHPDHIQANRITLAALEMLDEPPTLFYNAIPNSVMEIMRARWEEEDRKKREKDAANGIVRDDPSDGEEPLDMGTPDEAINATIDISGVNDFKYDALAAHASQIGESGWMEMGREKFKEMMTREWFVRVTNPQNQPHHVEDLFAGYR